MRRAAVVVAVLALLVAACGDDDDAAVTPGATTTTVVGQSPTTAATAPDVTTVAPSDQPTTSAAAEPTEQPPDALGAPGSFAPGYLQAATGGSLVVEVASQDGAEPEQGTLDHVRSVLADASGKSVSVVGAKSPQANDRWTSDGLRAAVADVRSTPQGNGTVVLRLLFVHGHWADDDSVLGVSFQADAAAIFIDDVRDAADPLIGAGAIEVATTTHEVGHLLGLVDLYLHTGREDPDHPGHSTNTRSVMYWAVESSLVTDLLTGGPPRDFDAADKADLATIKSQ
jgi:hypothetical protein